MLLHPERQLTKFHVQEDASKEQADKDRGPPNEDILENPGDEDWYGFRIIRSISSAPVIPRLSVTAFPARSARVGR
ncbi:hypothetical protein SAMN00790413_00565 [Deinococcus hopiensis KR-140]|uniref:Uncharacterized protein n=1 Tax=Deinococcus hopiensis KR-140 TaxID=695939 RepID=A0A1W1VA00_9DEIO|nr:hypothetical protein SAMN00790413_00565 [Deinococcus hopiensis KR-140]